MYYPEELVEEVRARNDIVDVISGYVTLKKKGSNYWGCCPFHNEKTPSFSVSSNKQMYYCFGCHASGNVYTFLMKYENDTFPEAVKILADRAGVKLPEVEETPEQKKKAGKRMRLLEVNKEAARYFYYMLRSPHGEVGMRYLTERKLTDETMHHFGLGYAGKNGEQVVQYLRKKGFTDEEIKDSGLAMFSEQRGLRSQFWNRVMFPIQDINHRVIGFGGRVMGDGEPKYLNSPETMIFDKRRNLYGLNFARTARTGNIILCEGYMDVIALDKYGFGYAVAPLGTALTEDQIEEAWKVCEEPVLCFDGDNAGIRAAIRSVDRGLPILKPGYSLRYAFLPDKMDPDEFLKSKGSDEFLKILNETMPLKDLLWRKNVEGRVFDTPEQKALIEKNVREEVAKIQNETIRGYYLQEMQDKIYNELGRGSRKNRFVSGFRKNESHGEVRPVVKPKTNINDNVSRFVVSGLLFYPALIGEYEERLASLEIRNADMRKLLDCMLEAFQENDRLDFTAMYSLLKDKGLGKEMLQLWEVAMFKQQNPEIYKIREDIDTKIIEEQLLQLENEIKECLSQIEASESFPEELYKRYESLKSEKEALLNTQPLN